MVEIVLLSVKIVSTSGAMSLLCNRQTILVLNHHPFPQQPLHPAQLAAAGALEGYATEGTTGLSSVLPALVSTLNFVCLSAFRTMLIQGRMLSAQT